MQQQNNYLVINMEKELTLDQIAELKELTANYKKMDRDRLTILKSYRAWKRGNLCEIGFKEVLHNIFGE